MITDHLKEHDDMSYGQHMKLAWWFSWKCLTAAFYAFCHGVVPNSFSGKRNAAATVRSLVSDYCQKENNLQ